MPKNRKARIRNRKRTGFSLSGFLVYIIFGVEPGRMWLVSAVGIEPTT